MPLQVVDIFCGVGGLTYGISKVGIDVIAGFDIDHTCRYAYEKNNKSRFFTEDIRKVTGEQINSLYSKNVTRVLVGCAPCQPFSNMTRKYKKNSTNDEKWDLLLEFGRIIEEVHPDIISMENVPHIQKTNVFKKFLKILQENGYQYQFKVVYCPKYGVPQNRRRIILLASTLGPIHIISETHTPDKYETVRECIYGLPIIKAGEICKVDPLHRTASLNDLNMKRIRASKPGGSWKDWEFKLRAKCHRKMSGSTFTSVYARMEWDRIAPTITTQFYCYGSGRYGHPDQDRALTIREGALLQTFPRTYKFVAKNEDFSIKTIARHIGNAVPVKLGEVVGLSIIQHLKEIGELNE